MGQEVSQAHFDANDVRRFETRLADETTLLRQLMEHNGFSSHPPVGGFEIEAWLVDADKRPAPVNALFFERYNNPLATPELAKFNIELNNTPRLISGDSLRSFEQELLSVFKDADKAAKTLNTDIILIGTLPTLKSGDCSLQNMSDMKRYQALNESILNSRGGRPLKLDIRGKDHLNQTMNSVMMEAATTSFQVHLQTPWDLAHHYYNASILVSAPIMAISGNSPLLFGRHLWQETRIPLFEQAVDAGTGVPRVSFGTGYAQDSICECFEENLREFPVLLPMVFDDQREQFSHLRLHNGVIWRWNRPLVGFDADGTPHIRIEHRILPAGPSFQDMLANAAFYYGLTRHWIDHLQDQPELLQLLPFEQARRNFYQAAKNGLESEINWFGQTASEHDLQKLIIDTMIPDAEQGLRLLGVDDELIGRYLGIIAERTANGQTGAVWQTRHLEITQGDTGKLLTDYLDRQHANLPVHQWDH